MRATLLRSVLVWSVLGLTAATGSSRQDGGEDECQAANKVEWDAMSPSAFKIGMIKASGTVTVACGWKCDTVVVLAVDAGGLEKDKKQSDNPNPNWAVTLEKLPSGIYNVSAKAYFRKGTMADTKEIKAVVTVK